MRLRRDKKARLQLLMSEIPGMGNRSIKFPCFPPTAVYASFITVRMVKNNYDLYNREV